MCYVSKEPYYPDNTLASRRTSTIVLHVLLVVNVRIFIQNGTPNIFDET